MAAATAVADLDIERIFPSRIWEKCWFNRNRNKM